MNKPDISQIELLRIKAQEALHANLSKPFSELSESNILKLMHEIEVHQIELELQQDEIINAEKNENKQASKIDLNEYIELLNLTQASYFSLSAEGDIIELNGSGANILGKERAKLRNSRFGFFVSDDSKPIYNQFLDTLFNKGTKESCEIFLSTGEKTPKLVYLTGVPNRNREHCLLIATDITDRKYAHIAKRLIEKRYHSIFENLDDIYYKIDLSGKILYISPSIKHLTEFNIEDFVGKSVFDLYFDYSDRALFLENLQKEGKLKDYELKFRTKLNEVRYVSINATFIYDEKGKPIYIEGILREITRRKEAELQLINSEERLREVLENSHDASYKRNLLTNSYDYLSPVFYSLSGYTLAEIETLPIATITDLIHPNDRDDVNTLIEQSIACFTDTTNQVEYRFKHKDGHYRWFIDRFKVIRNRAGQAEALIGSVSDITISKNAEKKLELLNRAIEQSPSTVVITDKEGNIEYVNPKFTDITGYQLDEVKGKNPRILQSGLQTMEFYKDLWQTILAGNDWHGEFQNKKKNGDLYWESAVISPILDKKGEISSFLAVKEDITEKKEMIENLIKAKEHAEESDRLKSSFLANMSHEIRTPMNGILGFAGLLKEPNLTGEEQQEFIRIIEISGIRMLNIINDIISISKVEAGQMEISVKETNINDQIEYLNTFFTPEVNQKGIQLLFKTPLVKDEAIILTDREKLYAILTNLVKNAIKYTQSGTIEFGYILTNNEPAELQFFVKDSGSGVPPEQKNYIFERFRQGSESLTRNYEGAGLGLTISKAYVEMLGGKIWVESEYGKGATFYFTLPYNCKAKEIKTIEKIDSSGSIMLQINSKIAGLKVLIAEDDMVSEKLISRRINSFCKEIIKAVTGLEAVEICRNNPDIDLILMDIKMPVMDGFEATRQIREFNKDVIIIAQTAFALTGDREKVIAVGCNDYIAKPFGQKALLSMLKKYFK